MENNTNTPNIFILLGLDPKQSWNQAEFEKQLQKKRQEWSRLVNLPTKKGLQAKQNLGYISDLKKIAADETQRQAQAAEARKLKSKAQAGKLEQFEERLQLLQLKGHILEAELKSLLKDFAGILSKKEIRKRIKVPIEKPDQGKKPRKATLDPTTVKDIQRKLQGLGKSSLYDFLGMDEKTEIKLLVERANTLYKEVNRKASKTPQDTLTSELSGQCLILFKDKVEQAKYNESCRLQRYDSLKEKVDVIARVSKKIGPKQMEQLLRDAKENELNLDDAQTIIVDHATKKGYAVVISEQTTQIVAKLQNCGYCGRLNPQEKKHCTDCGELLKEPCPKCGQTVASDESACGACGFPVGNRPRVKVLINEADQAQRDKNYETAVTYLQQAAQAWPTPDNSHHPLNQEIKALKDRIAPAKKTQEDLLAQMQDAMRKKQFYAAKNLLPRLTQALPAGSDKIAQYRRKIETKLRQVETKLPQAHRTARNDPEKGIELYQEILGICQDCQEARDMLAKTPPLPPSSLRATVGGKIVHLTWQMSRSKGVQYAIVRKKLSRPVSVNDGEKLATVSGAVYDDSTAEVGVPIFYAVFADREGVSSKNGAILSQALLLQQDVRNLSKQVSDGQVQLQWQPPLNTTDIIVMRSATTYPRSIQEGQRIAVLGKKQAVDSKAQNGRRYFYTVFCQFKDYSGKLITTSGSQIDAIPQQPPEPIKELLISADGPPHARRLQLRWQAPSKGDALILKSSKAYGLKMGDTMPRQELEKYGQGLTTTSNQVIDKIDQLGFYYFLPVVIFQDIAYIGQETKYVSVDNVSNLSVENLNHTLRLNWDWPLNCREVLVVFSYKGWPKSNQTNATMISLTRAQYDLYGYYDISNPVQADHYIIIFAVINQDGQKIVASGESKSARKRVSLMSRITVRYEIKKSWFGKKFTLNLTVNGSGTLPSLILTNKQSSLPLKKTDGETILKLKPATVDNNTLTFDIPKNAMRKQNYAKLFLEDDDLYDVVTIRHPGRDKLRLF